MNSVSWLIQWFLEEDPVRQTSTSVDRRTQQQTWEKVLWFSVIKPYIQSVSLHPLSFHPTSFICSLCLRYPVQCVFYISLCVFFYFSLPIYFRLDIIFSPPTYLFSHFTSLLFSSSFSTCYLCAHCLYPQSSIRSIQRCRYEAETSLYSSASWWVDENSRSHGTSEFCNWEGRHGIYTCSSIYLFLWIWQSDINHILRGRSASIAHQKLYLPPSSFYLIWIFCFCCRSIFFCYLFLLL